MSRSKRPQTKQNASTESKPRLSDGPSTWVAVAVLALAIGVVYGGALNVPFVFDDDITLTKNESIKSLWPLIGTGEHHGPLNPPGPLPTTGRPLVNLTFAINYAL